ncbi:Ycf48-like protein [Salinivirga cyanobacteriivorans]|uniref:Ycf48-like protein n=1 Tax=Salinivirga cyanobacteriivorans TaxID=1307839 RepID=A0A0S2I0Z3_9BACT|nr:glycosyl hydrolase [Salinivirga cyanobacteriivorans]ALO15927.1 Ycf48-like protein [Salinivirga cyanobacteriivorans]
MKNLFLILIALTCVFTLNAQDKKDKEIFSESSFSGLKFRSIGPAFMSGRIADIAIHPQNNNIWYVAVGSGGVWKTRNAGTTWNPIFDKQSSYSIGCVTIDENNPNIVWVGTGENIGGRHVGYGDGIYLSKDAGKSWENMGLKKSEHISKIIIHPENSDIVWVAAQGPLWSKGGERGLYKTSDGGKTWRKTLGDDEWVGATDIVMDPRNPDRLYAATWQRHRNVAAYMGGGPGTAIYKSEDGGENWEKLEKGLPKSNMGKIGLAISPQKPDVIYAAIELDRRTGGLYKSTDRGASWSKQSDAVSGATGPHYYQELYASPHQFDKLYLVDVRMQVSEDGGKTFKRMKEKFKHSDNHSVAFRGDDPDYLLIGTDGGIYETFDAAENWRYIPNLPITQFYKVAVDDAKPFYNIYGGTQDNNTQGGPSRTDDVRGISNSDWEVVLFADGHQPATEPGNPDIVYAEWQQGNLVRVDRTTGEFVYIQPQPEAGEDYERFNWDAPILVSSHKPTRIYFASQRIWKSENRGDSWTPISGDLTKNQNRIELPIMDKQWSYDAPWDMDAMSNFNTITSLAESPVQEGLIYAGTDDGIIQVTEDGGGKWRKIMVDDLPKVPETAFVNDIKADLFDANTVYVVLDNHKYGDFDPYVLKSTDKGKSWKSIKGNLPDRTLLWRIVQDHVNKDLMFLGTEFGIYFTVTGGEKWAKLSGGVPTISFRDLAIQRRENDLVGASFGRSFYVLDDYSALRQVTEEQLKGEAKLFPTRKAWWYKQRSTLGGKKGSQGAQYFTAPNPPFGAVFTYYIGKAYKTLEEIRKEKEKELIKEDEDIPFPGWEKLDEEKLQEKPKIILTVKNLEGNVIRKIEGPAKKGFHRVNWNLKIASQRAINPDRTNSNWQPEGHMVAPGKYTVTFSKQIDGVVTNLSEPMEFEVERMRKGALEGAEPDKVVAFWEEIEVLQGKMSAVSMAIQNTEKKMNAMEKALSRTDVDPTMLNSKMYNLKMELDRLRLKFFGSKAKSEVGERNNPTIYSRISAAQMGTNNSTYGPTQTHKRSLEIAQKEFKKLKVQLKEIMNNKIPAVETELQELGAPWISGQKLP